ncbi:MAG: glycosyltransferase family 2 protein [Clostridia bacterium]|jgi:glycosyltransferase involved in cell wall biosynthesis
MKLIIQVPCYNEEKTFGQTFADFPKKIDGIDEIEYLVINDGSTDSTVEVARSLGVHHIVSFKNNKGLAEAFKAGLDACLRLGADIIVNTDADNQYFGGDIETLVAPILARTADIVIGERPIEEINHFSWLKKRLQRLGSWTVRVASSTDIPDAPSGFRAYTREAALRLNVVSSYTYTLETIIQAGRMNMAITSVPIRVNPELRKSRLFKSMSGYVRRSVATIFRVFMMYKPLKTFLSIGIFSIIAALIVVVRFLTYYFLGSGNGHVQSLILAAILAFVGTQMIAFGMIADLISSNRKILEDIQYRARKSDYHNQSKL